MNPPYKNKGVGIYPFFLLKDKTVLQFFDLLLTKKHIPFYTTSSLDDLYVISDLNLNPLVIDESYLKNLPASFFAQERQFILFPSLKNCEEEKSGQDEDEKKKRFQRIFRIPINIKQALEVLLCQSEQEKRPF